MIYLDNAATSLKKPASVAQAMGFALKNAAGAGRSAHAPAMLGAEILYDTRLLAARMFGLDDPNRVIFTMNATQALNMALFSLARSCHHFAISPFEHNAVLRPLRYLEQEGKIRLTILDGELWNDEMLLQSAEQAIADGADCFVLCHVSNVFGYIQPLPELDALLAEHGIPLVVDASQSAGIIPLDCSKLKSAVAVCMPGHKGLYGPPGTGLLLALEDSVREPLLYGGTGSNSESSDMPEYLPDRLESGTHNVAGVAGLYEGMKFLHDTGIDRVLDHEQQLCRELVHRLAALPQLQLFAAPDMRKQTGVLSFIWRGLDVQEIAACLAAKKICVRAGLHCAPLAHKTAGTLDTGTVRLSPGWFQSPRQMRRFCFNLSRISRTVGENPG